MAGLSEKSKGVRAQYGLEAKAKGKASDVATPAKVEAKKPPTPKAAAPKAEPKAAPAPEGKSSEGPDDDPELDAITDREKPPERLAAGTPDGGLRAAQTALAEKAHSEAKAAGRQSFVDETGDWAYEILADGTAKILHAPEKYAHLRGKPVGPNQAKAYASITRMARRAGLQVPEVAAAPAPTAKAPVAAAAKPASEMPKTLSDSPPEAGPPDLHARVASKYGPRPDEGGYGGPRPPVAEPGQSAQLVASNEAAPSAPKAISGASKVELEAMATQARKQVHDLKVAFNLGSRSSAPVYPAPPDTSARDAKALEVIKAQEKIAALFTELAEAAEGAPPEPLPATRDHVRLRGE